MIDTKRAHRATEVLRRLGKICQTCRSSRWRKSPDTDRPDGTGYCTFSRPHIEVKPKDSCGYWRRRD